MKCCIKKITYFGIFVEVRSWVKLVFSPFLSTSRYYEDPLINVLANVIVG